jgi:hypothetical protein
MHALIVIGMEKSFVARYVGTGKTDPPTCQLNALDHAMACPRRNQNLINEGNGKLTGCLLNQKRSPNKLQSSPADEDRCCNCTKGSTCATKRCECRKAKRCCLSCDCLEK